jgi:hypothetical protein
MTTTEQANIIAIAQAVRDALAEAELPTAIIPERGYISEKIIENLTTLRVIVAPAALESVLTSRSDTEDTHSIDIGVLKKLSTGDNAEVDPLVYLVDEIRRFFKVHRIDEQVHAVCIRSEVDPIYDIPMFYNHRVFQSVVRLEYRTIE